MSEKNEWKIIQGYDGKNKTYGVLIPGNSYITIPLNGDEKINSKLVASAPKLLQALELLTCEISKIEQYNLDISPGYQLSKAILDTIKGSKEKIGFRGRK